MTFPTSFIGGALAALYIGCAIYVVADDRKSTGGGWITMHGMATFLITFPISAPGEFLGMRPDYRRNLDMTLAIGGTAALIYLASAGVGALFRHLTTNTT